MSLEEAARELRYRAFLDYGKRRQADRVALAHTANDQAEEVLIGLIRGAGLGGLAGIPVKKGPFHPSLDPGLSPGNFELFGFKGHSF